jgi:subtilisin family serine protease
VSGQTVERPSLEEVAIQRDCGFAFWSGIVEFTATVVMRSLVVCLAAAMPWLAVAGVLPAASGIVGSMARRDGDQTFRSDRFLVQPKPGAGSDLGALHTAVRATVLRQFSISGGTVLLSVPAGDTVLNLVARYRASGLVRFAEPDYLVHAACGPNDPKFTDGSQWAFFNYGQLGGMPDADIDAVEAWTLCTTATNLIVAIVDSGVRYTHEDLQANLWTNSVDGSYGTNALAGTTDPLDDNGHGTEMAGIIGAVGNNGVGVAGVAWQARLMACKFLDQFGGGAIADGIACIEFARSHGAKIINLSWGGTDYSDALSNALAAAQTDGIVFVAAAGNALPGLPPSDNDVTPFYPASYRLDNLLSVANTTRMDSLADTSNYGSTNVSLAAPGNGIFTTGGSSDSNYVQSVGTSPATAMTAGALALVWSQFSSDNYTQAMNRLLTTVDPQPALAGKCVTGGRLNLRKALGIAGGTQPTIQVVCGDTNLVVHVHGTPCRGYVIETSTNLINWAGLNTNMTSDTGVMTYVVPVDSPPEQYFRAYGEP